MKYLPVNTLAYYNAAPQVQQFNLSDIPIAAFSASTKLYRETCDEVFPNDEALSFYALNHAANLVRTRFTANEPLPEWAQKIMADYTSVTLKQGTRMLHYILSICAREMRHLNSHAHMTPEKWKLIQNVGGTEMITFLQNVPHSEDAAVTKYMTQPPDVTVGQYINAMSVGFHKTGWGGGSYGGPKWGVVADAAVSMLTGETSMEQLVDTGYTLAHNGGPIFNKGMMYSMYSLDSFLMILDIQRSGQIPELLLDSTSYHVHRTEDAKLAIKLLTDNQLGAFRGWVNWQAVEDMLPSKDKGRYLGRIAAMKQAHPEMVIPVTPAKPKKPVTKTVAGKKVKITGEWQVYPGVTVPTFERTVNA